MGEPTGAAVIECHGLVKRFRTYERRPGLLGIFQNFFDRKYVEVSAVDGVDLSIERGELVGLIGANGAGKTTLVKTLVGIVPKTSGETRLLGVDSFHLTDREKVRLSLVMGQRSQLWWDLPPIDSFRLLREIYEVDQDVFRERVDAYAARLDVTEKLGTQLRLLSLGQRMKMEIIGAFLHDPEVVFLDEPTIGLDLVSREEIRAFLRELNEERGATIVLTSHDMEDIEETCRRLVILEEGRVLYDGDLVSLRRRIQGKRAVQVHLEPGTGEAVEWGTELVELDAQIEESGADTLTFVVPSENTRALVQLVFERLEVRDLAIEPQPLEHLIKELFRGRRGERVRQ